MLRTFPILIIALVSACASGELINFDEFAADNGTGPILQDQYQHLGVTFFTDSASIWDGLNQGDPGGFGVNGTNGPQFLGFTTPPGGNFIGFLFDQPVRNVRFDIATGGLWDPEVTLIINGHIGGMFVGTTLLNLQPDDGWETVSFDEQYTWITISASSDIALNYAIDNLRWNTVPAPCSLALLATGVPMVSRRKRKQPVQSGG